MVQFLRQGNFNEPRGPNSRPGEFTRTWRRNDENNDDYKGLLYNAHQDKKNDPVHLTSVKELRIGLATQSCSSNLYTTLLITK